MTQSKNVFFREILRYWMLWPFAIYLLCGLIASIAGCKVNAGGTVPCEIFSINIGPILSLSMILPMFGVFAIFIWAFFKVIISIGRKAEEYKSKK